MNETSVKSSLLQTGGLHQMALTIEQTPPHSHAYQNGITNGPFDNLIPNRQCSVSGVLATACSAAEGRGKSGDDEEHEWFSPSQAVTPHRCATRPIAGRV